jgi:hypothetical protein
MATVVRCPTCYREELREGPKVQEILIPGGSRRVGGHPDLTRWKVWRRALAGELDPVVGDCKVCEMPVVGLGPDQTVVDAWEVQIHDQRWTVTPQGIRGPKGPATPADLNAALEKAWGVRWTAELRAIPQLLLMAAMFVPLGIMVTGCAYMVFLYLQAAMLPAPSIVTTKYW